MHVFMLLQGITHVGSSHYTVGVERRFLEGGYVPVLFPLEQARVYHSTPRILIDGSYLIGSAADAPFSPFKSC